MPRRPKSEAAQTVVPQRLPTYQDREINVASPWVLPVYVLSTERDEHRHLIPREAKCTIDTGNLQGNIVSRAFAVDVLGYTEQDFHNLTNDEVEGGAGVTGHKLIPDGAIYLTWYHSNSTRVFRDMRFLISEHPMYDLIIGARSIQKNRILDVPNLMTTGAIRWNSILDQAEKADSMITPLSQLFKIQTDTSIEERLRMLESKVIKLDEAYDEWKLTATNDQKMRFSEKKNKEVEDEKDILKDAIQAEYRNQIRKEEKRRSAPTTKSAKLRQEYKDEYEVTLDFPLPAEKIA
jgi:hypothetical protein